MYCEKCGQQLTGNTRFCIRCGQPVPFSEPPKKGSNKSVIVLAVAIALTALLLIASVTALFLLKSNEPDEPEIQAVSETEAMTEAPVQTDAPTEAAEAPAESKIKDAAAFSGASASSVLPNESGYSYGAKNVLTSNNSCWCEGSSGYGVGEWIKLDLPEKQRLYGIVMINGYAGTEKQYSYNGKLSDILIEFSGGESARVQLKVPSDSQRRTAQPIFFDTPVDTEYVKITIESVSKGQCADTCLTYVAPYKLDE